jgi:hypothetical protein
MVGWIDSGHGWHDQAMVRSSPSCPLKGGCEPLPNRGVGSTPSDQGDCKLPPNAKQGGGGGGGGGWGCGGGHSLRGGLGVSWETT